jgi:hypothetical protein
LQRQLSRLLWQFQPLPQLLLWQLPLLLFQPSQQLLKLLRLLLLP